ncbi:hypothetical protein FOIG_05933 [Fusarium odoratissimum NRRL 54006]|uniref:Uncharacterized protein n=1 Tax=Fusarium odoratissimum (strain NRRL 54006) TaxID=1089451 RepID=X0JP73_FUSO5|nr:uncharacterized protein FOIG_05933 [Fusarium odoratissimum NRRL 54006]EXM03008.1 hypothetical protein FOIG_05933 [Fusarium odoratissimum NRRL 54006]
MVPNAKRWEHYLDGASRPMIGCGGAAARKKATINKSPVVTNLLPLSGLGWRRLGIAAGVRSFLLFQWLVFFILQPPTGILTAQEDGATNPTAPDTNSESARLAAVFSGNNTG